MIGCSADFPNFAHLSVVDSSSNFSSFRLELLFHGIECASGETKILLVERTRKICNRVSEKKLSSYSTSAIV